MNKNIQNNLKKISLAIIDSFYELISKKSDFLDLELFEIQLLKYGLNLDDKIKEFFNNFISKNKTDHQIDEFSFIISNGIKYKYKYFNDKLENLKSLYEIIIWIETHTEFTALKFTDDVFSKNLESFYQFILFYIFKKEKVNKIEEFSIKNIKIFMTEEEDTNNNFTILELIFKYLKHTNIIIKTFLSFSKDKDYFKFIIIQKKLSKNEEINKLLTSTNNEDYTNFLLYLITFNPYITIDDFKINFFKKDINNLYLFIKAILYRFRYYKINYKSPNTILLLLKYLFNDLSNKEIYNLLQMIDNESIDLFEPLINFIILYKDNDILLLLLLKIIKLETNSNNFMITYNLINHVIEKIKIYHLENRAINIFIGNFKKYLKSNKKFNDYEIKNFFISINLFLIEIDLEPSIKEKLFKMNLKLFEINIRNSFNLNPTLLSIVKHYNIILNKFLKEYDQIKDINLFITEVKNIMYSDNQIIKIKNINIDEIDPENIFFTFISKEIQNKITIEFKNINPKTTIYFKLETEGIIFSKKYFNIMIALKLILIYDILYLILIKLIPEKVKIKVGKNNIYILSNEEILIDKSKIKDISINSKSFYYHFINKVYSIIIIIVSSFIGFRIIIDALIVNNNKLLIFGLLIITMSLLIDYFLYFFFKQLDELYFFDITLNNRSKVFCSKENYLLRIIRK